MTDFIHNFRYRTKGIVLKSASNFILHQNFLLKKQNYARNYQRFPNCLQVQAIACKCTQLHASHPELTRVRRIRFLLYEIKRVLVYNSKIFKHSWRDNLLIYGFVVPYFFIQNMYMPLKKYFGNKLCLMGQIGIR